MSASTKRLLFISAFSFIWLSLFLASFEIAVYSRILLQFPAGGASFWKQYLFLAWMCLAPIAVACLGTKKSGRTFTIVIPLVCIAAIGIGMTLWLGHRFSYDASRYAIFVDSGRISSNSLWHSHVLKGAIGVLTNDITGVRADSGIPYVHLFPLWVFPVIQALFVWACVLMLRFLRCEIDQGSSWSAIAGSLLIGFYVLRSSIDGGALSPEFLASFAIFLLLLFRSRLLSHAKSAVALAALSCLAGTSSYYALLPQPLAWIARDTLMHGNILFSCTFFAQFRGALAIRYVVTALLIPAAFFLNRHDLLWDELRRFNAEHPAGTEAIIVANADEEYPASELVRSDGRWRQLSFTFSRSDTLWSLLRIHRLVSGYAGIDIVGTTCERGSSYLIEADVRTSHSGHLPTDCTGGFFKSMKLTWHDVTPDLAKGTIDGEAFGCVSMPNTVAVPARLTNCGLQSFVLIPRSK